MNNSSWQDWLTPGEQGYGWTTSSNMAGQRQWIKFGEELYIPMKQCTFQQIAYMRPRTNGPIRWAFAQGRGLERTSGKTFEVHNMTQTPNRGLPNGFVNQTLNPVQHWDPCCSNVLQDIYNHLWSQSYPGSNAKYHWILVWVQDYPWKMRVWGSSSGNI